MYHQQCVILKVIKNLECVIYREPLSEEEMKKMFPSGRKTKCCYSCVPQECDRCQEPVYAKIEWDVGCKDNPIRLTSDVCKRHVDGAPVKGECKCSLTSRNRSVTVYTWL